MRLCARRTSVKPEKHVRVHGMHMKHMQKFCLSKLFSPFRVGCHQVWPRRFLQLQGLSFEQE